MTINTLINGFFAFVSFLVTLSIVCRAPFPDVLTSIQRAPSSAMLTLLLMWAAWLCLGLLTRLRRVLKQPPKSVAQEDILLLMTPLTAPAGSGLLVAIALWTSAVQNSTVYPWEFWSALVMLSLGSASTFVLFTRWHDQLVLQPA